MVGVEDLLQEVLLAGCCPGLCSLAQSLALSLEKAIMDRPLAGKAMGDLARGLVFA